MQPSFAITDQAQQAGASQVGQDGTLGIFYNRPVYNEEKSQVEGRPIYDTVPFIKMLFPGIGKKVVDRAVVDEHKVRFSQAWSAFEQGKAGVVEGTPIEMFPLLSLAQVATMKHLGIVTVDQLAQVADSSLHAMGVGAQALRDRAKAWLQGSEAEVKTIRAQMLEMRQQLDLIRAENEALRQEMAAPKKSGKAKVEAEFDALEVMAK